MQKEQTLPTPSSRKAGTRRQAGIRLVLSQAASGCWIHWFHPCTTFALRARCTVAPPQRLLPASPSTPVRACPPLQVPFGQRPKIVDVTDRNRIVAAKIVETAVECSEVERDVVLYYLVRPRADASLLTFLIFSGFCRKRLQSGPSALPVSSPLVLRRSAMSHLLRLLGAYSAMFF